MLYEVITTKDANDIFNDPEISIVVELIGGIEPARSFILRAIEHGKHVVTANKALLSLHGKEIFEAAAGKGVVITSYSIHYTKLYEANHCRQGLFKIETI